MIDDPGRGVCAFPSGTPAFGAVVHVPPAYYVVNGRFIPQASSRRPSPSSFQLIRTATLADSKSEYVADLVRRDAFKKSEKAAKK